MDTPRFATEAEMDRARRIAAAIMSHGREVDRFRCRDSGNSLAKSAIERPVIEADGNDALLIKSVAAEIWQLAEAGADQAA